MVGYAGWKINKLTDSALERSRAPQIPQVARLVEVNRERQPALYSARCGVTCQG